MAHDEISGADVADSQKSDFLPWIKVGWCWCLSHSTQVLWRRIWMCWCLVVSSWYENVSELGTRQISVGHGEFLVSIWVATPPCSKNILFLRWGSDQWCRGTDHLSMFYNASVFHPRFYHTTTTLHVQPLEQLATSARIPQNVRLKSQIPRTSRRRKMWCLNVKGLKE